MGAPKQNEYIRFWQQVSKTPTCWLWTGAKWGAGYGCMWCEGRAQAAHRLSWMMHNGPIPDGMFVLHSCDTPACVRPTHLFLGTGLTNMRDCSIKGRKRIKLVAEEVQSIRALEGQSSSRSVAKMFDVTHHCVQKIWARTIWKYLN